MGGEASQIGNFVLYLEVEVRREHVLEDLLASLQATISADKSTLLLPLRVKFVGEDGIDEGGLSKDLLSLAIKELVNTTHVVAPCGGGSNENARSVWFTRTGKCVREQNSRIVSGAALSETIGESVGDFEHEFVLGLLLGLASYSKVLVDLPLPSAIYKTMVNGEDSLNLQDLYGVDAALAKGLEQLLQFEDGSIADILGITFTASTNPLVADTVHPQPSPSNHHDHSHDVPCGSGGGGGEQQPPLDSLYVDLCENGSTRYVDKSNRAEFVSLFCKYALFGAVSGAASAFIKGLNYFFTGSTVQKCSSEELELLLCGSTDVGDLSLLRLSCTYRGDIDDESPLAQYLWETLSDFSFLLKKKFLQFVSGSDRVPVGGLANVHLIVQSTAQDTSALPSSHTCFNVLDLPMYESKEQLREKLLIALEHMQGFGLA